MDFTGSLSGGLAGQLHFGDDGDTIDVDPIITSGSKIATITVNAGTDEEVSYDLYAPEGFSGSWNDLTDKPNLFSGSYVDLSNKPTYNGDVFTGNMYGQKWDSSQDIIIGYHNGAPVFRRTYENISISQYIDLGDVPEWTIFNITGTIESTEAFQSQYGCNQVVNIPNYLNNNYWFRIYYMNDGADYTGSHNPILYFEYSTYTSNDFDNIPILYIDYQIKSNS